MTKNESEAYFGSRYVPDAARDGVWREIARYLERYIARDASVLDLGAGYCSFINQVRAGKKFALDRHEPFRSYAAPDVTTAVKSCEDLSDFKNASLDVVFASNLLEHLDDGPIDRTLSEVMRVLKPGGRVILVQPNFRTASREYFNDYTHRKIFTDVSLADLLTSRGFRPERVEARFLPLNMKSRLPKWPWLTRFYLRLPFRPLAGQMLVVAVKPLNGEPGHVER